MHIAFLTPEYPHERALHAAGIGTSIKNLAVTLVQNNIEVTVVVYGQKINAIFEGDGVQIHLIKKRKYQFLGWYLHRIYIEKYFNNLIQKEKIDIAEAPDWTGITAFMNLKAPLIIRFHGSDTYFCHIEKRKQKVKNYWFEKLATKKAIAFIAPTSYAGTVSRELFSIPVDKVIQTIHYGLNLEHFINPTPSIYEKGMILYIGTIIRKKGVFELPAILEKVTAEKPYARLVLIGTDSSDIYTHKSSTWELLEQEFKKLKLTNYSYLGQIPYGEVREYIQKAQVCVFPSFAETLGMVTIESMALQKPVVNTNIGWAQELMVDGESGFLVNPLDHQLFAERILTILNNPNQGLEMGKKAKQFVEQHFDINKKVIENIQFYKEIIAL